MQQTVLDEALSQGSRLPEHRVDSRPQTTQRYVTIDRWISSEAYDAFVKTWKEDYEALDAYCRNLTERESLLGAFTQI